MRKFPACIIYKFLGFTDYISYNVELISLWDRYENLAIRHSFLISRIRRNFYQLYFLNFITFTNSLNLYYIKIMIYIYIKIYLFSFFMIITSLQNLTFFLVQEMKTTFFHVFWDAEFEFYVARKIASSQISFLDIASWQHYDLSYIVSWNRADVLFSFIYAKPIQSHIKKTKI